MFPSSSNNCGHHHFPFTNQSMLATENENPSSSQHHHQPSPFLDFPADQDQPFLPNHDNGFFMTHFFSQHQILGCSSDNVAADETEIKMASPVEATKKTTTKKKKNGGVNGDEKAQAVQRKRTGKKDRHSKIYTAQGPRDRRMRLSLQIARKFFDLQDTLGFDKASKTIEWLLSKSKAAIKELTESLPSVKNSCSSGAKSLSSTSESEVVSGIKRIKDTGDQKSALVVDDSLVRLSRGAMNNKSRKAVINPIVRESRDKARARARERTLEKMKMRGLEKSRKCSEEANPNDLEQLRPCSPSQEKNSPLKVVAEAEEEEDQMDSVRIIEKFLGFPSSPRSSSIFDYTLHIGESTAASSQQNNPPYSTDYNSYYVLTNMKGSTSNLHAKIPGDIFNINPDTCQEEKSSLIYTSTANSNEQNPSSDSRILSNSQEQNPTSIFMTTSNIDSQPQFLEDQFACNPIVDNRYCSLY
ncbi:transcription factor TCP12 [Citrus sinensis]|uniref:Transcription factor TCP12 n=2 Tax=Citrus sinensis TaxID=2711 RepID=A0ACB8LEW8_CITSI|nr:transcription factor TCP12 [Citrus sinensis]